MAWLTGWKYRKSITLSRASGAVTNYQMQLLVGESSGATGEAVDCGGKCLSTFNDLRFTNAAGTVLDYWIESITGTTPNQLATVWIEFDSIGTGATTFYMYYGNAGAAAYSNGANTFIVFDDFERGADGDAVGGSWTVTAGSPEIDTAQKYGGTRSCLLQSGTNDSMTIPHTAASSTYAIRWRARVVAVTGDSQKYMGIHGDGSYRELVGVRDSTEDIEYFVAAWTDSGTDATINTWQLYEITALDFSAHTFNLSVDGGSVISGGGMQSSASSANVVYFSHQAGTETADMWIDDVIVRNWRATGPAWGSWGAETVGWVSTFNGVVQPAEAIGATQGAISSVNGVAA